MFLPIVTYGHRVTPPTKVCTVSVSLRMWTQTQVGLSYTSWPTTWPLELICMQGEAPRLLSLTQSGLSFSSDASGHRAISIILSRICYVARVARAAVECLLNCASGTCDASETRAA